LFFSLLFYAFLCFAKKCNNLIKSILTEIEGKRKQLFDSPTGYLFNHKRLIINRLSAFFIFRCNIGAISETPETDESPLHITSIDNDFFHDTFTAGLNDGKVETGCHLGSRKREGDDLIFGSCDHQPVYFYTAQAH